MIVSFAPPTDFADLAIEPPTAPLTRIRRKFLYHQAVMSLREHAEELAGVIIADQLSHVDYHFEYFIEHIRTEPDPRLARVPIIVKISSEEDYYRLLGPKSGFKEDYYRSLAVVATIDPTIDDFSGSIDANAWEVFQRQAGAQPLDRTGRHDQANAWGAYVVLAALTKASPGEVSSEIIRELERRLCGDTFYKKLVTSLQATEPSENALAKLRQERRRFFQVRKNLRSILVVEDQLRDGWEDAYRAVLGTGHGVRLTFSPDSESAKDNFRPMDDLVLLDIRLAPDRDVFCQEESGVVVDDLSGVKLARWFHEQEPTVPVVAATASNKSWTLESLLQHGIGGYWVKGSPEITRSFDEAILNVSELYAKLNQALLWSARTRGWIKGLYRLAALVTEFDWTNGKRLESKAKSLHALLHGAFGPFRDELAKGLQMNLAFLVAFSGFNDLISWICREELDEMTGETQWFLGRSPEPLVTLRRYKDRSGNRREFVSHWETAPRRTNSAFPDTDLFIELASQMGVRKARERFKKLRRVRNGLPLTHGKAEGAGTRSNSIDIVKDEDLSDLIDYLCELAMAYKNSAN